MGLFAKFTYTQEVLIDLLEKGMRIEEVACRVQGERSGKSRVVTHWYSYGIKASIIVIRTLRDYKPMQFFGTIGLLSAGLGLVIALYLWAESWVRRAFSPGMLPAPAWVSYASILLIVVGFLLMVLALVADMLDRQGKIQEEMLYRQKKKEFEA
jgi:hypothetical protein